jgi:hypothetical protein
MGISNRTILFGCLKNCWKNKIPDLTTLSLNHLANTALRDTRKEDHALLNPNYLASGTSKG